MQLTERRWLCELTAVPQQLPEQEEADTFSVHLILLLENDFCSGGNKLILLNH